MLGPFGCMHVNLISTTLKHNAPRHRWKEKLKWRPFGRAKRFTCFARQLPFIYFGRARAPAPAHPKFTFSHFICSTICVFVPLPLPQWESLCNAHGNIRTNEDKTIISMRWCNTVSCCLDSDIFSSAAAGCHCCCLTHETRAAWQRRQRRSSCLKWMAAGKCSTKKMLLVAHASSRYSSATAMPNEYIRETTRKIVFNLKPYRFPPDKRNMNDIKYKYER